MASTTKSVLRALSDDRLVGWINENRKLQRELPDDEAWSAFKVRLRAETHKLVGVATGRSSIVMTDTTCHVLSSAAEVSHHGRTVWVLWDDENGCARSGTHSDGCHMFRSFTWIKDGDEYVERAVSEISQDVPRCGFCGGGR